FYESVWKGSIVPFSNDAAYYTMHSFGSDQFNLLLAWALGVVGTTLGQIFNYYIGYLLAWLSQQFRKKEAPSSNVKRLFQRYTIWMLLFCWVPFFNFLTVFHGFAHTRRKLVFTLLLIGNAIHYALPFFSHNMLAMF